jgi:hypothetical protein
MLKKLTALALLVLALGTVALQTSAPAVVPLVAEGDGPKTGG